MSAILDQVLAELSKARGIDLSGYRRSMLERRLGARLAVLRINEPAAYLELLRTDQKEFDRFVESISINVTSFFRNPLVWEVLAQSVLPSILERNQTARSREIRVWSAGCASGEEAYSIAILMHEVLKGELASWKTHIFATDLSEEALKTAARGVYPRDRMENTRLGILDQYFTTSNGMYEVRPFLRRMVWFSRHDLTSHRLAPAESIFGTFDLVLCRNVLIYFARPLQDQVFRKLIRALAPGGYLVLGDAEQLERARDYGMNTVERRNRIYQKLRDEAGAVSKSSVDAKAATGGEHKHA